ncbi:carboxyl-terminal protease [Bizionia argentinensis JUB59]|uniref:Carboxyl-terminal protease n=1 Tax=Bizionia argentinensis JUB59 TaxID=1046627 RepID=G2EC17_9FLAO|nr:S41 family peptidase [Bizionia argentinensis]EGV44006.2 carboxyl-terminal protease [Bizionia argentinensis JUB59]
MKTRLYLMIALGVSTIFMGCSEDLDDNPTPTNDLNGFVWRGLNTYYLYKDNVPDLANNRFASGNYQAYLNSYSSPEDLFNHLKYQPQTVDRFSWITSNYIELEEQLSGTTLNNGMDFGLMRYPNGSNNVFGYVGYVLPNSDASNEGVERGMIFNSINGTELNTSNYNSLLSTATYSINLASYDDKGTPETNDDTITSNGQSITLSKSSSTENPIFKSEVFNVAGANVGYLMYNGFTRDFDSQLNDVFGEFKSQNVQNLVLDLRYNSGGSVNTAILLSSMIANKTGEVFSTEQWNSDIQSVLSTEDVTNYFTNNDGGTPLNILTLNKVYILTTKRSASASELVINCLDPYMDVVHIGTETAGKFQASVTLYDSPNFNRANANPSHLYAMQPLIFKTKNSLGVTDYSQGLTPNISLPENYGNMGVIGNETEPLLATALQLISNGNRMSFPSIKALDLIGDKTDFLPVSVGMYK